MFDRLFDVREANTTGVSTTPKPMQVMCIPSMTRPDLTFPVRYANYPYYPVRLATIREEQLRNLTLRGLGIFLLLSVQGSLLYNTFDER